MLRVDYVTREAAEALVERQNGDGRIISRLSFSKDGNRIFFVACSASAEDYGLLYKIFAAACASFKLTNPAGLG